MKESIDRLLKEKGILIINVTHKFTLKRPISICQWIIRKLTKSEFDHTAILIEIEGIKCIVEATVNKGVKLITLENWVRSDKYTSVLFCTRYYDKSEIKSLLLDQCGNKSYDLKSVLYYHIKYYITGKWDKGMRINADKSWYCSELVSWVLRLGDYWTMTPQDIFVNPEICLRFKCNSKELIG